MTREPPAPDPSAVTLPAIAAELRALSGMWWAQITPQDAANYAAMADLVERVAAESEAKEVRP